MPFSLGFGFFFFFSPFSFGVQEGMMSVAAAFLQARLVFYFILIK